jgi:hypothetical protein
MFFELNILTLTPEGQGLTSSDGDLALGTELEKNTLETSGEDTDQARPRGVQFVLHQGWLHSGGHVEEVRLKYSQWDLNPPLHVTLSEGSLAWFSMLFHICFKRISLFHD